MSLATLYVHRPVLNAEAIIDWAKANGFGTTLTADDMHVTLAYSRAEVDWTTVTPDEGALSIEGGDRSLETFGADGQCVVLAFNSQTLTGRWAALCDAGATWDWPDYRPHITLTYADAPSALDDIAPYDGVIELGGEEFAEVKANWADDVVEAGLQQRVASMKRKFLTASTETLADKRQVLVVCSTGDVDRAGEVIVQSGIDLSAYSANPVVLWQHDPMQPIARAIEIGVVGTQLRALVQFPEEGTSVKADEVYGLIKAGVINCTSVGFMPVETEPMSPAQPKGPQRYTKSEMTEFSFVSVPANPNAVIVGRSAEPKPQTLKVGTSRNLPIGADGEGWDGEAAATGIFDHAAFDSDSPDSTYARKGFLAYDAAAPDDRASYFLPIAKVIDGRLTVTTEALTAAAANLATTALPPEVAAKARAVLDHYEGKMTKAAPQAVTKDIKTPTIKIKGLYDVARLAEFLQEFSWIESNASWESEYEGDGSKVPAMLGAAMQQIGAALIAMTQEEVAELLGEETAEGEDTVAKGLVGKDAKPLIKALAAAGLQRKQGSPHADAHQTMTQRQRQLEVAKRLAQ